MYRDRKQFVDAHSVTSRYSEARATQSFLSGCNQARPRASNSVATNSTSFSRCPARARVLRHQRVAMSCATMQDRRHRQPIPSDAATQTQIGQVHPIVRAIETQAIGRPRHQPDRRQHHAQVRRRNLHRRLRQGRPQAQRARREFRRLLRSKGVRRPQLLVRLRRKQPRKA